MIWKLQIKAAGETPLKGKSAVTIHFQTDASSITVILRKFPDFSGGF